MGIYPGFRVLSIACLVFFGGLASQLFTVSLSVMILGLLAFIVVAVPWLRKEAKFRFPFPYSNYLF